MILYQKLFNLGLRKYQLQNIKDIEGQLINIRKCSGMGSFKALLIQHPILQKIMNDLLESG